MVKGQGQVTNDLVSIPIMGGPEAYRSKILSLNENKTVFARNG
jgi:hypothetical protein